MTANPPLSEAYGGLPPWGSQSPPPIWQSLSQSASAFPDKLAIASLHQSPGLYGIDTDLTSKQYLRWSYASLSLAVDRFASGLIAQGVSEGQTIATFLYNGVEYVIAFWAAHKLGCTFVPINPRTLINGAETTHMLSVTNASVVVVQDGDLTRGIDAAAEATSGLKLKVCVSDLDELSSWNTFANLMKAIPHDTSSDNTSMMTVDHKEKVVTVLFTSGTTSLPKGCPHTDTTLNAFFLNLSLSGQSETDTFCSVLPNNHAMCYFYCLYFFCHGGAVVFPSPNFEAAAMLSALEKERCTHTCLVPTALFELLNVIRVRGTPFSSSLVDVCLAGASVSPDNMRQVVEDLGSRGVSIGFGMTEGSPIWSGYKSDPAELLHHQLTVVGTASPGARVRICEPDSRSAVARSNRGEIHQCGPGVISGYLGGVSSENFYQDEEGRQWFMSGDQAIMHADGLVSITGRYKDMIIRGGENISPASIEDILNKFEGVQAQVVGVPDAIAGEIPVAVVRGTALFDADLTRMLRSAVLQQMGPAFTPDRFTSLVQLGLEDFPRTTSGKVQKAKLADLVLTYMQQQESASNDSFVDNHTQKIVVKAWFKATGIAAEHLDLDAPYTAFADSIAVMRVRDSLRKELGMSISVEDVIDHPSIRSQIEFVSHVQKPAAFVPRKTNQLLGPPSLEEMVVAFGDEHEAVRMRGIMSDALETKGFSWSEDVGAVIPSIDYMSVLAEAKIIDTWNFAIAVVADASSTAQFRTAIEKTLRNNPLLTSLYVQDHNQDVHYVLLKPTPKLYEMCIIDHGSVQSPEDVQKLAMEYPYREHATAPGPLFRCLVINIEQTNSAAMVMYLHHIIQDATSMRLVCDDLDQALAQPTVPLRSHTDFKVWADSYRALRHSPAATLSVNYHVNRLKDLHLHKQAIYPAAKVPRQAIQETPDGLDFGFDAPGLIELKTSHPDLTAAVVLKAAMALVNVNRTGYTHAVFNNFEAGRGSFPFVPDSVRAINPDAFEAADVGGPTMEGVCNLVEVPRSESAIDLIRRMQREQTELSKHCHAPLRRVIHGLNAHGHGSGDTMVEVHRTHFLTWIPGFLGEHDLIKITQLSIRCVAGLVVVAGLGGPHATTYMISMRWDVANYSRAQTAVFVEDLKTAILWLTEKENWDLSVRVFLELLSSSQRQAKSSVTADVVEVSDSVGVESH